MPSVSEAKLHALSAATTFRAYGHPLETSEGEAVAREWLPIHPCLCVHGVQDSARNPCSCPKLGTWWVQRRAIAGSGRSGRKDDDGKELTYYDLALDTDIVVEALTTVPVRALSETASRGGELTADDLADVVTVFSEKPTLTGRRWPFSPFTPILTKKWLRWLKEQAAKDKK